MRNRETLLSTGTFLVLYLLAAITGFPGGNDAPSRASIWGQEEVGRPRSSTRGCCEVMESPSDLAGLLDMLRSTQPGLRRRAATALGKSGDTGAVSPLIDVLLGDKDAHVRNHAAWALGQIGDLAALEGLANSLPYEQDQTVRDEIKAALAA